MSPLFVLAQTFQINSTSQLSPIGRGDFQLVDVNNDERVDVILSGINDIGGRFAAVYRNNDDGTFTNFGVGLPQVSDGGIALGDVNNDGLVDIFITGEDDGGTRLSQLFVNQGGGIFTLSTQDFTGLAFGSVEIVDLDNDGLVDIVATGIDQSGIVSAKTYINTGNSQFSEITTNIEGTSNGDLLIFDFNNDAYPDILVSGLNGVNQRVTQLYLNNQDRTFTLTGVGLPAVRSGVLAAADYNQDGFQDLFISGNQAGSTIINDIYLNNAGGGFILDASLTPLEQGTAAWGDFDHDGDFDIITSGFDSPNFRTFLYENTGTGFVETGIGFPGLTDGNLNWADYNGDNKLDLFVSGFSSLGPITNVYDNDLASVNAQPGAPNNLLASVEGDSVIFSWDAGTDTETTTSGLGYNIYVGTTSGAVDLRSPSADLSNGVIRIPRVASSPRISVLGPFPEGTYFWSAQTVDAGFRGSNFATEQSFVVCDPVDIGRDTSICVGQVIALQAGTASDVVNWFSREQGPLANNTNQISFTVVEDDSIYVTVEKPLGCTVSDGFNVTALALPSIDIGTTEAICDGDTVALSAGILFPTIEWSSFRDGQFSSDLDIAYTVDRDDTVRLRVEDVNQCVNTDSLIIEVVPLPVVDLGPDQTICLGSPINLTMAGDSVNWQTTNGLEALNNTAFQFDVVETDTVVVEVFDLVSRCSNQDTLIADFFELPLADAGPDQVTCPGTTITIGGDYTGFTDLTFSWTPSATLDFDDVANPQASPNENTEYVLTVGDLNGCQNMDTVLVRQDSASVITIGEERNICLESNTTLGGDPTATGSVLSYTYEWSPSASLDDAQSPNPIATPTETTTYRLITRTLNCIVDTSFVTINVDPLPVVTVEPEIITIGLGEIVTLTAQGGVSYSWTPSEGLNNIAIPNPEASPEQTTLYEVEVTDENDCISFGSVTVQVRNQIFIPDLFTPNGDFNNDSFRVFGDGIATLSLRIYDRNGELAFSSDDINEIMEDGWDGSKDGEPMPSGHYAWAIEGEFFDGSRIEFQGNTSGILKLIR